MRAPALALALILAPLAVATVGADVAHADGFDDKVKAAKPVHDVKGMTALFWSQSARCSGLKNDLLKRQCEGVRDQRQRRVVGETYVIDAGSQAFDIVTDDKKNSVEVRLRSCLWCDAEGPLVLGKGVHKVESGRIQAALVGAELKTFEKAPVAEHWAKYIATRLRAQFLVTVPKSVERFKAGGRDGYKVEVVGYRLYDPCQGNVLVASPASKKGPVAVAACKDEPAMSEGPTETVEPKIVHPDRLTTAQIKDAMKEVLNQTRTCYEAYGIEGMATFKMIIGGNGKLAKAEQTGDFEGTPTGVCLDKAVRAASFPESKKKATPVTYPIVLR